MFYAVKDWMAMAEPAAALKLRRENGWLRQHFPELDCLYGIPQASEHHPEIDTGIHIELSMQMAGRITQDPAVRFAVLVHDLGKGVTQKELLPRHVGHEKNGLPLVSQVADRFCVPQSWKRLALVVCEGHLNAHRIKEMNPRSIVKMFREYGFYDSPELLEQFLLACEADKRGRQGLAEKLYSQKTFIKECFQATASAVADDSARLHQARVSALKAHLALHATTV